MESLENSEDALAYLKSQRKPETSQEAPSEDVEEVVEDPAELEAAAEEESEESVSANTPDEEVEEPGVYLIDDEEVTLEQIQEWKKGTLRESDYTQKTQDLATQRKSYEAKDAKLSAKEEKFNALITDLEQSIDSQESKIDWEELADDDPSQYLKEKAKIEKKQKALDKAKESKHKAEDDKRKLYVSEQQQLLPTLMPHWVDSKGATDAMNTELKVIGDYLSKQGFSDQEMNAIVDAKLWPVYADAAKYRALKDAKPEVAKKLKKAPKVIKPTKAGQRPLNTGAHDDAAKRLKKSGNDEDGMAYLKSKRTG
jgi:hypothetical protein